MEIVNHGGMPLVEHAVDGFGGFLSLLVCVAIDVHKNVFAPVGRGLPRQRIAIRFALQVAVEPVDLLVAAVGIRNRIDEDDQIFANMANHGLIGNRKAIGQFKHGFGRASFIGVEGGVEVVDRTRIGDEFFRGRRLDFARIRKGSGRRLQLFEILNSVFIADGDKNNFAAFFRLANGENANPWRSGCKRAAEGVGLCGIHQFSRSSHDSSIESAWGGNAGRRRKIGDPGRKELRGSCGFGDFLRRAGFGSIWSRRRLRPEGGATNKRKE